MQGLFLAPGMVGEARRPSPPLAPIHPVHPLRARMLFSLPLSASTSLGPALRPFRNTPQRLYTSPATPAAAAVAFRLIRLTHKCVDFMCVPLISAPQAVKGSHLIAAVMAAEGFETSPVPGEPRHDVITSVVRHGAAPRQATACHVVPRHATPRPRL